MYDVFRILPYEGKVVGVELDGRLLIDLLNKGKSIPDQGGFLQKVGIACAPRGNGRSTVSGSNPPILIQSRWPTSC